MGTARVEVPDSCPDFKGRATSRFRPKLAWRAVSRESVDIPKFGRKSLEMPDFGRQSLDMPNFGLENLDMPKFCRESLDMSLGPRPGWKSQPLFTNSAPFYVPYFQLPALFQFLLQNTEFYVCFTCYCG